MANVGAIIFVYDNMCYNIFNVANDGVKTPGKDMNE